MEHTPSRGKMIALTLGRMLVAAIITAFVTLAFAFALGGAQRSLAARIDGNTAQILKIISQNVGTRDDKLDAIFCVIATGDFTQTGVDNCLIINGVEPTYETEP